PTFAAGTWWWRAGRGPGRRCRAGGRSCPSRSCFFQAEDGIRDRNVTGVQTCALPIFEAVSYRTEDDYVVFDVSSFSQYAVVYGESTDENTVVPPTSDDNSGNDDSVS